MIVCSSIVPSHEIADWLLKTIRSGLDLVGLKKYGTVEEIVYFMIIIGLCVLVGWVIKKLIMAVTNKIVKVRNSAVSRQLLEEHTLTKCSHIIPPIIFMGLMPVAFTSDSFFMTLMEKLVIIYTLFAFAIGLNAVLTFVFNRYNERENTRNLPIKGILNVAKGVVWIVITIISVSVIIDKSPGALLAGLGAFAAALLLIFKNSILGFVAGIQMSQNDMLRVGDWIVVPSTIANGIVIDVSLTVVKVQNWDNTIVMVPPFTLVNQSFQNWRGMSDSGMRQIERSFIIDITTVKALDDAMISDILAKVPDVKPFVDKMRADNATIEWSGDQRAINGTLQTNLGLYRAYLCQYLVDSQLINKDGRVMVRTLAPVEDGIPLQVWCFTSTTEFNAYEAIQSALFEHIATTLPLFGLAVYASGTESVELSGVAESPIAIAASVKGVQQIQQRGGDSAGDNA